MQDRKVFNRYLTHADERQLFNHVWKYRADMLAHRDWHWMQLLRQTGMRINNLAHFTLGEALDVLSHPHHHYALPPQHSKKQIGYTLKFNRKATQSLRALISIRKAQGFFSIDDDPLIMSRRTNCGLSVRTYQSRMKKWVRSAGLSVDASPHWFRHTLAKRILASTQHHSPLQVVQFALGHSSLQTTEIYTRPDRSDIDQAMEDAS